VANIFRRCEISLTPITKSKVLTFLEAPKVQNAIEYKYIHAVKEQ